MKKLFVTLLFLIIFALVPAYWVLAYMSKPKSVVISADPFRYQWEIQSVDTMKYSRDMALEKLNDSKFDAEIDRQMKVIATTGATHVAIATPYDEKFAPIMKRWVDAARKNHLKVWFRGNFSGWEGWFGFPKTMTRVEHMQKTREFITKHPLLFEDGDIFTSCPECENGGPGDPRINNDVEDYRSFLVDEYRITKNAFASIRKDVRSNTYSMNGDVARLIMDPKTTAGLDGVVTIDHYVTSPETFVADVRDIAKKSGGKILLGEWGVGIPDLHGDMSQQAKADWMNTALAGLSDADVSILGMNYWVSVGGSTELWSSRSENSLMADTLRKYYAPSVIFGRVTNELGEPIEGAEINANNVIIKTDASGRYEYRAKKSVKEITVSAKGYKDLHIPIANTFQKTDLILSKSKQETSFKFLLWLKHRGVIK